MKSLQKKEGVKKERKAHSVVSAPAVAGRIATLEDGRLTRSPQTRACRSAIPVTEVQAGPEIVYSPEAGLNTPSFDGGKGHRGNSALRAGYQVPLHLVRRADEGDQEHLRDPGLCLPFGAGRFRQFHGRFRQHLPSVLLGGLQHANVGSLLSCSHPFRLSVRELPNRSPISKRVPPWSSGGPIPSPIRLPLCSHGSSRQGSGGCTLSPSTI